LSNIFPSLFSAKCKGINRGKILVVTLAIIFISIASFSAILGTANAAQEHNTYSTTLDFSVPTYHTDKVAYWNDTGLSFDVISGETFSTSFWGTIGQSGSTYSVSWVNVTVFIGGTAQKVDWTYYNYNLSFSPYFEWNATAPLGYSGTLTEISIEEISEPTAAWTSPPTVLYSETGMTPGETTTSYSSAVPIVIFSAYVSTVTFTETGLPSGATWYVTIPSIYSTYASPGTSIVTSHLPNGTYSYSISGPSGYVPSPSSGTITVNGGDVNVSVIFAQVSPGQYTVTFMETGLPSGIYWEMSLGGTEKASNSSSIQFTEQNGTYDYSFQSPIDVNGLNYTTSPDSGSVTVSGQSKTIDITYGAVSTTKTSGSEYEVTFLESGLPTGSEWYVNLNGIVGSSFNNTIVFYVPAGNYSYVVSGPNGYIPMFSMGSVSVDKNTGVSAIFSPTAGGGSTIVKTVQQNWWIIIGLTVLSIVVGWVLSVFLNPESKYSKKKGGGLLKKG